MPLKSGSYELQFMVDTGAVPMTVTPGTLTIEATAPPLLKGSILVPKLFELAESFSGTQADAPDGTTTFLFTTTSGTTLLSAYGMTILCGTAVKIMAGTNITNPPNTTGLPTGDPNQDACWVATHSGAGEGDGDDDDGHGKGKYGR